MANTNPPPVLNGKDAKLIIFYDGKPVPGVSDLVTKWSIKQVKIDFRDGYCGRDRKRVDDQVDGYDLDAELHYSKLTFIRALQQIEADRDARLPEKELAAGVQFKNKDGTNEGLVVAPCKVTWDHSGSGQGERQVTKITIKGEDWREVIL